VSVVTNASSDPDPTVEETLAAAARLVAPFARMYLGPSLAAIGDGQAQASDARVLQFAFSKLVLEAGTLPLPSTDYAPHATKFTIDERGYAPALDLPFVLGALRATAAWAAAPPRAPATTAGAVSNANNATSAPAMSARELRSAARVRSYAAVAPETPAMASAPSPRAPVRTGGCGCRKGSTSIVRAAAASSSLSYVATSSAARRRAAVGAMKGTTPDCGQPSYCACGGTCGGTGCGCAGTSSCTDCIPRGSSAGDLCTCGCCTPPEDCTPWTPSCATRNRLRDCVKTIICDLLECVETVVCAATLGAAAAREARANFSRCLLALICKLMRCLREAICPPPCTPNQLPVPNDCIPCDFAVEGL